MTDGPTPVEISGIQQSTEAPINVDQETVDATAFIHYLHENHIALLVRGSTGKFVDEHRTQGSLPKGTYGYSYWTVFSPDLNPELLDPSYAPKLARMISFLVDHATGYTRDRDQSLVLTTLLPMHELTESPEQQGYPFNRTDTRFWRWGSGKSSLDIGKGTDVFPGFRTNKIISPQKLGIFYGDETLNATQQIMHMRAT